MHATNYVLGFNCTVFQMWVDPDSAESYPDAARDHRISGPLFSLLVRAVYWVLYRRRFREDHPGSRS